MLTLVVICFALVQTYAILCDRLLASAPDKLEKNDSP
jgi:hypothetical protein